MDQRLSVEFIFFQASHLIPETEHAANIAVLRAFRFNLGVFARDRTGWLATKWSSNQSPSLIPC